MTDRSRPKLVEVEWRDSVGAGGWHTPEDIGTFLSHSRPTCLTAGYVVVSDREKIVVAQSLHNENRGALMEIPRRMVVRVRHL